MTTIEKTYDPSLLENKWYEWWDEKGYFAPNGKGNPFTIVLPPPNVTGSLHMGHGFQCTLMDILIRYHRMCGDNTLWQAGTDHAGIATQMVVERQLNQAGLTRHDLGREDFLKKIWEWKQESGGNISRQLRRLGASLDWEHERFTLDESLSKAVRDVFIKLFDEGIIYRGERLVNWDPSLLTAISDLEVINEEEEGKLYYIRYPLVDSDQHLVVATTRPETLLGDVAVAVNPNDERFQHLIGKYLELPLTDRQIPIIADDYVDPTFGTGCVKITPAHDFNDYQVGLRHQLKPINVLTPDAHLNENAPSEYQNLERFVARKKIIDDLQSKNLLEKIDKHTYKVPRGEKSGSVVEPYLTQQWFMKMKPLAEPAIKAVQEGKVSFIPDNWSKIYFQWLENIEDWCISRQLWWGHRIPVWYDNENKIYVGQDEADVRTRYKIDSDVELSQDEDVLDTWFSSALWPFSSLGWPEKNDRLETFFPTSVLVTGFDIIFFWVARMIMMSLKFTGEVPFKQVYITGLIRDAEGQKMSKSKGNVLDPIDLIDGISLDDLIAKRTYGLMQPGMAQKIEKATRKEFKDGIPSYGTDALRFTFSIVASHTRDIRFDTHRLQGYRNFCNKLWNAARYVEMNVADKSVLEKFNYSSLSLADKWILTRLQKTIAAAHEALQQYRFDYFAQVLYDFTWNEYCDWYVELSKPLLLNNDDAQSQAGTRKTLVFVMENLLRLLHPIMPFITEEIWQRMKPMTGCKEESIMLAAYPSENLEFINDEAEREVDWLKQVIVAIRTIRSEMNIPPGKQLDILLRKGNKNDKAFYQKHHLLLTTLAKLASVKWLENADALPKSASAFIGELEIYIPLAGLINKDEEKARLNREIAKVEKELQVLKNKLANESFVAKAPPEVVAKEKNRHAELMVTIEKLQLQLTQLSE